jgi:diketogulonate reductase-like aldo/keto reductase
MISAPSSPSGLAGASGAVSNAADRTIKFPNGTVVPALGQGSARLAQGRYPAVAEEKALRTGITLGMTLIDTAELYNQGRSEELIGHVIAGQRNRVFVVSKVTPNHVTGNGIARACEATLARLATDYLDLYLLHWRNGVVLSRVVAAFESLRASGKIRAWGVSNFSVSDMEELFHVPDGDRCATNQVPYNVSCRGIEYNLLPWCARHYCPLGGNSLVGDPILARIGAAHGCSASAIALAWALRSGNVIAIPESGSTAHVKENAAALSVTLTPQELQELNAAHPIRWADVLRSLLHRSVLLNRSARWLQNFLR